MRDSRSRVARVNDAADSGKGLGGLQIAYWNQTVCSGVPYSTACSTIDFVNIEKMKYPAYALMDGCLFALNRLASAAVGN